MFSTIRVFSANSHVSIVERRTTQDLWQLAEPLTPNRLTRMWLYHATVLYCCIFVVVVAVAVIVVIVESHFLSSAIWGLADDVSSSFAVIATRQRLFSDGYLRQMMEAWLQTASIVMARLNPKWRMNTAFLSRSNPTSNLWYPSFWFSLQKHKVEAGGETQTQRKCPSVQRAWALYTLLHSELTSVHPSAQWAWALYTLLLNGPELCTPFCTWPELCTRC